MEDCLDILRFREEEKTAIFSRYARRADDYRLEGDRAYDGAPPEFPICRKRPFDRLVIWCCHAAAVKRKYQALGIPEEVIHSTFRDISLRAGEYRKKTGALGLSKDDVIWLRHIHNGELFQIGALQYQLFHMVYLDREGCGEAYMSFSLEQKMGLPQETPVLNVHIPVGADLSDESVCESLSSAKAFFGTFFPDFGATAFLCYSWLLYPEMLDLLPENSNIAAFASKFKIIGSARDPYGSEGVRRIYGRRFSRKAEYPQKTRLQRNALGRFSKLGMACGIIEINS